MAQDAFNQATSILYDDFNADGVEDAVCYSDSTTSTYQAIAFITLKDKAYSRIETDMEDAFVYEQSIRKEGDFIIRRLRGGGTGMSSTTDTLYTAVDGKILNTHATLQVKGYESMMPNDDYPYGRSISYSGETVDMSYKVGTDEDQWLIFQHTDTTQDDNDNQVIYTKVTQYTYMPENHRYYQEVISEEALAGSLGNAYLKGDHYDAGDLMAGQVLDDFNIVSALYNPMDHSLFKFEGIKTLEGTLHYDNVMSDDYYFESDKPLFDAPIMLSLKDMNGNITDTVLIGQLKMAWFANDISPYLTPDMKKAFERPPYAVRVKLSLSDYTSSIAVGSEGGEQITVTQLEWLDRPNSDQALSDSEVAESIDGQKLTNYDDENFQTPEGPLTIHYPDYRLVIVPLKDSMNASQLGHDSLQFEGDYINPLQFTVFGKLENVTITNYLGIDVPEASLQVDALEDTVVTINANLPTDTSYVTVSGQFYDGEGTYLDVSFNLDDMRSPDAYQVYTFE